MYCRKTVLRKMMASLGNLLSALMIFRFFVICGVASVVLTVAGQQQELTIRPSGDTFTRPLGSNIVFTCSILDSLLPAELQWIDSQDSAITARMGRVYSEEDGLNARKLFITSIENRDSGQFTCRAIVPGRSPIEKYVRLFLFKDITFEQFPTVLHPAIYTDVTIDCHVSGNPAPTITWKVNGQRINLAGRRFELDGTGLDASLKIINVSRADNGNYTCRAEVESDGRYAEQTVHLTVHIPPRLTGSSLDHEGVAGNQLAIYCQAEGLPPPTYQFFKESSTVPLVSNDRVQVDEADGTVQFRPVLKEDEGLYTCRISNDVGTLSAAGTVTVLVAPEINHVSTAVGEEKGVATLECVARGDPIPDLSFVRANETLTTHGRYTVTRPSAGKCKLEIRSLEPSDNGSYTCMARNKLSVAQRDASLLVKFSPRFAKNHPTYQYTWVGQTRNITCDWSAEPEARIEWLKGGQVITENVTYRIFTSHHSSSLQVTVRVTDQTRIYDRYLCRVTNELGRAQMIIELRRATAPDAPESVQVLQTMPTEVQLAAVPPTEDGGVAVVGYHIEYEDSVQEFDLDSALVIENLKPSTRYILRISAKNEVGIGMPKEQIVVTEQISAPYPIEIVSPHEGPHAFEYSIKWARPITGGMPITQYRLRHRKVEVEGDTFNITQPIEDWTAWVVLDNRQNQLEHRIEDLKPLTNYQVEVNALNGIGWSSPGPIFVFRTGDDPKPPRFHPSSTGINNIDGKYRVPPTDSSILGTADPNDPDNLHRHVHDSTEFNVETGANQEPSRRQASMSTVSVVLIVFFVALLFVLIIDVSCFFVNKCGVTFLVCNRFCGQSGRRREVKSNSAGIIEDGDGECEKKPLSDLSNGDGETRKDYNSDRHLMPGWNGDHNPGSTAC